jgi:coatomer protein complex subunit gamma
VFEHHIVVQYNVTNTFAGSVIENVSVAIGADFDLDEVTGVGVGVDEIVADSTGIFYVGFPCSDITIGSISNDLKYLFKEIDPSTGEPEEDGYDDEYNMNALEITPGDYLVPTFIGNFQHVWDELANEAKYQYQLPYQSIAEAIPAIVSHLSMQPLEGSDNAASDVTHNLKLFARLVSGEKVAALVKIVYSTQHGLRVQISARSDNSDISEPLAGSLESLHS